MRRKRSIDLSREMALRILVDVTLLNFAVVIALGIRFVYLIAFQIDHTTAQPRELLWRYVALYRDTSWLLTLVSVLVFYISGFYTHGRSYRGRYKALFVAQAISLAYLLFGFLSYFLRGALLLPRGALFVAWVLTIGFLVGARLWAKIWANVLRAERGLLDVPGERKVRKVLVIGGAGYIGSALLPKLLERGYRVRLLDGLLYGTEPIQDLLGHPRLEVIQADFRHVDKVVEAAQDVDAVVHLGAIVGDPACALDEDLTIEVNLMATRMIAEVAKGCGVSRFIFASTCSVYGASDQVLNERSMLNPVSLYARSKIASERVLLQMADSRFAPTILRFGTIYGLSGRTRFDLVVNLLTAKALVDGEITIFGGDQCRPFLHVDDAAAAILKALEAPLEDVRNQVFNVGSDDQNYTIQQIGSLIHRLVPTAVLINGGEDTDPRNYRVSFAKIRKVLGFTPRWTVEQGVQQVIDAIASGKISDYRDAKYSNVKFLKEQGPSRLLLHEQSWARNLINEASTSPTVHVEG